MQPDTMLKVICTFSSFAEEHKIDFDDIVAAYAAANQAAMACQPWPPFLVTSSDPPTLDSKGCYKVEIKPMGFSPSCDSEKASAGFLVSLAVYVCEGFGAAQKEAVPCLPAR